MRINSIALSATQPGISGVITSCGRHDLLAITLESLFRHNSYPLEAVYVIEDGPPINTEFISGFFNRNIVWLSTGVRVGQIQAIDLAYRHVKTPYIFHCEDDWRFLRGCFIEKSLNILIDNPKCLQVYLRAHNDTNGHPVEKEIHHSRGSQWQRMTLNYDYDGILWHGFSFNPGLRRLQDYRLLTSYGKYVQFDYQIPWKAECELSHLYYKQGFYAAILSDAKENGYVKHIGRGRRVSPPTGFFS